MNDILFCNSFSFLHVKYSKSRYTDCRSGSPLHYLARMVNGSARIVTDSGEIRISEGDWFYIPLGCPYQSYWTGEPFAEWDSFGFTYIPDSRRLAYKPQLVNPPEAALRLTDELHVGQSVSCRNIGIFYEFLGECLSAMEYTHDAGNNIVAIASEYMAAHPDCKIREVAAKCCVSESGLYHIFRKYAKCTPVRARQKALAERALEKLVGTDMPVEEISRSLGFSSTVYFRKVLREIYGKTPSELRRQAEF